MNGYTSRKDWMREFVTRLVEQELADIALTAGPEYAAAAKTMRGYGLHQHVGFALRDRYCNLREFEDIVAWRDGRKEKP